MSKHAPASAALILCALVVVIIGVLTGLHDTVPNVLELIAIGSLTGATGLAMPALGSRETVTTTTAARPPAPRPAPPVEAAPTGLAA